MFLGYFLMFTCKTFSCRNEHGSTLGLCDGLVSSAASAVTPPTVVDFTATGCGHDDVPPSKHLLITLDVNVVVFVADEPFKHAVRHVPPF